MKTSSVTWKLARQWQTIFIDGESLALEALEGLAHGSLAATGLQDSWLTSSSSSLSPLLSSSLPQWQGQMKGWSKGCPPPWCHPVWSVQQQNSTALIWKKAHTQLAVLAACKSKCWPSALAAGIQKCKAKGTKSLLPFSPLYLGIQLVKMVQDAVCSVGSLSSSSCCNID